MCDYSLEGVKTRAAKTGDQLILVQFSTGSQGFTDLNGLSGSLGFHTDMYNECAVCLKSGTKLQLSSPHDGQVSDVLFVQRTATKKNRYRDSVLFLDESQVITLQDLPRGMAAEVLTLPGEISGEDASIINDAFEGMVRNMESMTA